MSPRKDAHAIDTRFTWSGDKAKAFIELAKEEYGKPLPYGAILMLIRLACNRYVEARRNGLTQMLGEMRAGEIEARKEAHGKEKE